MKELGRVTFSPDTTSGGGSPRASLGSHLKREKEFDLVFLYDERKDEK
jgi:hypothetical protein